MSTRNRNRRDDKRRGVVHHQHHRIQEQQARRLRSVDTVNPPTLQPGDIVRARVVFEEGDHYKARPVVVYATAKHHITALVCTTNLERGAGLRHVTLEDLTPTGLRLPSAVNPARLVTIDRQDLLELLGRCSPEDWETITREVQHTSVSGTS